MKKIYTNAMTPQELEANANIAGITAQDVIAYWGVEATTEAGAYAIAWVMLDDEGEQTVGYSTLGDMVEVKDLSPTANDTIHILDEEAYNDL